MRRARGCGGCKETRPVLLIVWPAALLLLSAAAADAAERDQWPAILAYLEQAVAGRDFLVGVGFTLADIAVTSALASSLHATAPIDAAGHPELARYLDKMLARPAFARRLEAERGFIAKVRARVAA